MSCRAATRSACHSNQACLTPSLSRSSHAVLAGLPKPLNTPRTTTEAPAVIHGCASGATWRGARTESRSACVLPGTRETIEWLRVQCQRPWQPTAGLGQRAGTLIITLPSTVTTLAAERACSAPWSVQLLTNSRNLWFRCASELERLRRAAAPTATARLSQLIAWSALPLQCREGARTVLHPFPSAPFLYPHIDTVQGCHAFCRACACLCKMRLPPLLSFQLVFNMRG
jgi:hypothetical protein